MKLFIKKVVLFLSLSLAILFGLDYFLKTQQKNLQLRPNVKLKKTFAEKSLDPEIMIYGSSIAEGALSPLVFEKELPNYKAYNSALSGRRIQDWISLFYEHNSYSKNRKIIVLDIFPNCFNWNDNLYHIHDFYPYLNNENVKKSLINIDEKYNQLCNIPLYSLAFLNATYILNSYGSVKNKILNKTTPFSDDFNGYLKVDTNKFNVNEKGLIPVKISPKTTLLYEEMFSNSNYEFILVGAPVFNEGKPFYNNMVSVYNIPYKWGKEYSNVHYINFIDNDKYCNDKSLFSNYTHLNSKGADLLSKEVAIFIKNTLHE